MSYYASSPPPLQHPVPTHPPYIPDPPSTPASPQGYMRFASSPPNPSGSAPHAAYPPVHAAPYAPQTQYQSFSAPSPQPQHGQQQAHPQHPSVPNYAAWGVDGATAQLGMQLGQSAVAAGQDYVQKNFGGHIPVPLLKHHFNVSNSYVLHKLRLVLFPWRHRPWTRRIRRSEVNGQTEGWQPPREDINSPDLYIPTMALVTYVLLAALQSGLEARFDPEILGVTASTALGVVLLEFTFIKLGCYFLSIHGQGQVIDLVAYGGYKFVGIILTLTAGLLNIGRMLYWSVFLYSFCANAFFLVPPVLTLRCSARSYLIPIQRFRRQRQYSNSRPTPHAHPISFLRCCYTSRVHAYSRQGVAITYI
ncbi:YIF1-domain-containing protein [Gautieria morchelliformis]|nr:YIF1-domain-containing protein [Gautieria morchelliformis]